ncbi:MAG: TetR family transcriptional regulator [Deltaproteobacteria bacterium]|jgi:AcrR family transcriptional regulator|nr:TetR family transcriptional regulator [Deltaproteobacteria bacterium]
MSERKTLQISLRKQPKQARSTELVASIMSAAAQVLGKEGAGRFTTALVAERAGVSIGSLYQYFPSKAAILFQLQSDEWRQTTKMLRNLLEDAQKPPLGRLRALVHSFIRSECEEAEMRVALDDAAPLYRDAPEALEKITEGEYVFREFMLKVLPHITEETRVLAGNLIMTTLSSAGKRFSESPRTTVEIEAYAEAMSDMFCAYLKSLTSELSVSTSRTFRS